MGDRTTVTLSVLTAQAKTAEALFVDRYFDVALDTDPLIFQWTFEEVNYGELPFLHKLQQAGIAYDSEWGRGDEYGSGCKSCRFTSLGTAIDKEIYDENLNPNLAALLERIDQSDHLRQYILDHQESITTLPWDNQEEYGKRYRVTQLITT